MAEIENNRAMEEGMRLYRSKIHKVTLPTPDAKTLFDAHTEAQGTAITYYQNNSFGKNKMTFQSKLSETIGQEYQRLVNQNQKASRSLCKKKLQELEKTLVKNAREGKYLREGGYLEFMAEVHRVEVKFKQVKVLGTMANAELLEFMDRKTEEGKIIKDAEDKIVSQERQAKEAQQRAIEAKRQKEQAERAREMATKRAKENAERLLKASVRLRLTLNTGSAPPGAVAFGRQNDGAGALCCAVAHTRWGDIPGKAKHNTCWFPYDGKEQTTSNFSWVCVNAGYHLTESSGAPARDAVAFGRQNDGAGVLYCAVAHTKWGDIPGKAKGDTCWYPYDGREHTTRTFAWLCALEAGTSLVKTRNTGRPAPNSIALGRQTDGSGTLYCALAHTQWGDVPGKAKDNTCWYPYDGKEHFTANFSWVCGPCIQTSWLLTQNGGRAPSHATALGRQTDGAGDLYCGVAHTQWGDIPGKAKDNTCWYPYDGKEHTTSHVAWVGHPS